MKLQIELLETHGLEPGEVAYNPAIIYDTASTILAARVDGVESLFLNDPRMKNQRKDEQGYYNSRVQFFTHKSDGLHLNMTIPPIYDAEDPSATWVRTPDGHIPQLLFGYVRPDFSTIPPRPITRICLAPSLEEIRPEDPIIEAVGVKGIHFSQLYDGRIIMVTRPTSDIAAPGRVGWHAFDNANDLIESSSFAEAVRRANSALLPLIAPNSTRIAVDEAVATKVNYEDKIIEVVRVIGHTSWEERKIHPEGYEYPAIFYEAYECFINPNAPFAEPLHLLPLARRSDIPFKPPLSRTYAGGERYKNVIYPSGLANSKSTLYFGLEDAAIGLLKIRAADEAYTRFREGFT